MKWHEEFFDKWFNDEFSAQINTTENKYLEDASIEIESEPIMEMTGRYNIKEKINLNSSEHLILSIFLEKFLLLRPNLIRRIMIYLPDNVQRKITNKLKIEKKDYLHFISNFVIIPLVPYEDNKFSHFAEYNELFNFVKYGSDIAVYDDLDTKRNVLEDFFEKIEAPVKVHTIFQRFECNTKNCYSVNRLPNKKFNLWFSYASSIVPVSSCHFFLNQFTFIVNQLVVIAKVCENAATLIIPTDYGILSMNIFHQLLYLISTFSELHIYWNKISTGSKMYLICKNVNIKTLNDYIKNKQLYRLENINTGFDKLFAPHCDLKEVSNPKFVTNLNITVPNHFSRKLLKIFHNKNQLIEEYMHTINYYAENFDKNIIKYFIKIQIKHGYKYLSKYNYPISDYYTEKEKQVTFSRIELINLYFPKRKGVKMSDLKLTTSGIYSISLPKDAYEITHIMKSACTECNIIVDATANCGGNTINFAEHYKAVISIEIDDDNFACLQNNIKVYGFENVVAMKGDSTEVIPKLGKYNVDVIFFDPPWGGQLQFLKGDDLKIELSGKSMDQIIKSILDKKMAKYVFVKVPNSFNSKLKHKSHRIRSYKLLEYQ